MRLRVCIYSFIQKLVAALGQPWRYLLLQVQLLSRELIAGIYNWPDCARNAKIINDAAFWRTAIRGWSRGFKQSNRLFLLSAEIIANKVTDKDAFKALKSSRRAKKLCATGFTKVVCKTTGSS